MANITTFDIVADAGNATSTETTVTNRVIAFVPYTSNIVYGTTVVFDCSAGNYFQRTTSGQVTASFTNVPTNCVYAMTIEIIPSSGSLSWPASVTWRNNQTPSLSIGSAHLITLVTDDGGARWRGSALTDFTI